MAKVHPRAQISSSSSNNNNNNNNDNNNNNNNGVLCSKQETFTIWMKSLVMSGKGCTVFDSDGQIVYRVDNYNCKSRDVYLMDLNGEVLFTILRMEKFKVLRFWEGYRSKYPKRAGFQVKKIRSWNLAREIINAVGFDKNNQSFCYNIESCTTHDNNSNNKSNTSSKKSPCKIVDKLGRPIAEVKRKQSTCGVLLGDDVLTMVIEPYIDHCLVMGLFVVYSLINSQM